MANYKVTQQFGEDLVELHVYESEDSDTCRVSFFVNDGVEFNLTNKVAITRWLLSEFKGLQEWYSEIGCWVYEDHNWSNRMKVLGKLNFVQFTNDFGDYEMIWTK